MAAILKVWRQAENPTPSIDVYLLEEHFCPDPISNIGFFEDGRRNKKKTKNKNKMSNEMRSDPNV